MISTSVRVFGFCLLGLLIGCGGGDMYATAVTPPHDGTMFPVPMTTLVVEVVKKSGKPPITGEFTFYFYESGSYTPYDKTPESGVLTLVGNRKVKLELDGDALSTPSGPSLFGGGDIEGELVVTFEGEEHKIRLRGR